jgi:Ankyrin repeats (3 copies)
VFPNPQDALPLPARPNLDQYKKLAKELVKAANSNEASTLINWTRHFVETVVQRAHLTLTPHLPITIDRWCDQLRGFIQTKSAGKLTLTKAQFILARAHGFDSWPKFSRHLEAASRAGSAVSDFEQAADAIVSGDLASLRRLLRRNPALAQTRSAREHRSTLLHYVSANGVESYRQKTPPNIVEITNLLLASGAEVDASAEVYRGHITTLALAATSIHPERAGVQESLLQTLLDHGATFTYMPGKNLLADCLANGRARAARFLLGRGAPLNLESAAGLGRLDEVRSYFDATGHLARGTQTQLQRGFLWACACGHHEVIDFLLRHGASLQDEANTGEAAIHWAVMGGRIPTIQLLLSRGANLETKNSYAGTALGQALWSAVNSDDGVDYPRVIEFLIQSGAQVEPGTADWMERQNIPAEKKASLLKVLRQAGSP